MGKKVIYKEAVKQFLFEYASIPSASETFRYEVIADDKQDRYCLLRFGWENKKWTHHCLFHFDIVDGKIMVQQNWTDLKIEEELEALGVKKSDIVPGLWSSIFEA